MIATDLSKQQALDADPKAMHQITFTGNLYLAGNTAVFFIIEEAKETIFTKKTRESLVNTNNKYILILNININKYNY